MGCRQNRGPSRHLGRRSHQDSDRNKDHKKKGVWAITAVRLHDYGKITRIEKEVETFESDSGEFLSHVTALCRQLTRR